MLSASTEQPITVIVARSIVQFTVDSVQSKTEEVACTGKCHCSEQED